MCTCAHHVLEYVYKGALLLVPLQKAMYKPQLEPMLVTHVFSEFQSPHGYMRARVCTE